MPKKGANIALSSYDDIFSTEESREAATREQIQKIPISELHPFEGHPFRVVDDEAMTRTMESISQFGVISPLLARPDPDGGYEIVSGHRRHHAAQLVGLETVPVIVREMDDDEAIIAMVDSNLQRETILPSERAWAYRMKLDAIKHQGTRTDLTSAQLGPKLTAADKIAAEANDSRSQVKRYIRLTELIPELLDMVDEKKIALNPAVELSYLSKDEQKQFLEAMDYAQATPSLSQAQRLKKQSQDSGCSMDFMCSTMNEEKKGDPDRVVFKADELRKYFPKSYTPQQMEKTIIRLLEQWQRKKQKQQDQML
ncbi:MAG: ParB/RepB/Spo0J family partition protein [Lachnospiraceae bacterium]|nr:ParB/RepB/Spo0J family partition protein [Lachnospiraceae bacterium]